MSWYENCNCSSSNSGEVNNTHLIEGCLEGGVEAFTIVDDLGSPLFEPKPLSELGFTDCCQECTSEPFCVRGFDYTDLSEIDDGATTQWTINGNTSIDEPVAQDNGQKGSWYSNLIANVNSNSGWTMVVSSDVGSDTTDKPTFQITGPCDSELSIVRESGDTLTLTVDSAGIMTGTFEENGSDICSDCFPDC